MGTGKYDVNTVHQTKNYGELEVIGYVDKRNRLVRFIDTGYVTVARISHIGEGNIRDCFKPSVCGVGYLGEPMEHPLRKVLEARWRAMLNRVYNIKTGKTVDPSWLCFANFLRDAIELGGIELLYTHSKDNRIDLDSDILAIEKGLPPSYGKETCKWVKHDVNTKCREYPNKVNTRPIGTVIETKHGPVTIMGKDRGKWLIRFSDGAEKWVWQIAVLRNMFAKPTTSEV